MYKLWVILLCLVYVGSSCNYEKKLHDSIYFNDSLDSTHKLVREYSPNIQIDDRLSIQVSALSPESVIPYNLPISNTASLSSGINNSLSYLVEKDGSILFPQLGKIKVEGKTLKSLRDELIIQLSKFITDPLVSIQFANAKVLIMGEVAKVGAIPIPDGKLTIFEAITLSGDIIQFTGRKDNVLIVREENGQRVFARVNLQSHDIYKSPYYFLKQNDLVYVEANTKKIEQESEATFTRRLSLVTPILSFFSITLLILNYFRK
jgi:polysaccharide export outer membrane protein